MSTRTNIHFNYGTDICANIYRHSDGYPGEVKNGEIVEYGVLSDLLTFFRTLMAEVPDNRLNDAEYLAAKFLVWQSQQNKKYAVPYEKDPATGKYSYAEEKMHYLQFLGVSPCIKDHGDIEYLYEVDCNLRDGEGFPVVRWKPIVGDPEVKEVEFKAVELGKVVKKAAAKKVKVS